MPPLRSKPGASSLAAALGIFLVAFAVPALAQNAPPRPLPGIVNQPLGEAAPPPPAASPGGPVLAPPSVPEVLRDRLGAPSGLGPTTPLGGTGAGPAPTGPTAPPGTASGPAPAGPPLGPTTPLGGTGKAPEPAPVAAESCPAPPAASTWPLSQVVGTWVDDETGNEVEIKGTGPGSAITWKGRFAWEGTYEAGKLKLNRFPEPVEMDDAPDWAKQQVYKKVKWELELEPKIECGRPILEGKWYPGSFKWQEVRGRDGAAGKQTVSDIDRGTPIDVKFTGPPPSIVRVVVLQNQTSQYAVGHPNFPYPFQKGVDNTGDALRYRNLYVYGTNLPRNRDQKIVVTSEDPNIEYLVEAVQRDREITPGLSTKFEQGLQLALLAYPPSLHAKVRAMDAVLLRAELKRGTAGLLPGIKSFRLNDVPGSWELRFGDDGARVAFARPAYASSDPPTALREDEVQPTEVVFAPERVFLEVRTLAPFPLQEIPLVVGISVSPDPKADLKDVSWNGAPTITASRVAGSETIYRTPPIELVEAGASVPPVAGAYQLPVNGSEVLFARIADPWLLRQMPNPAAAAIYSGPGDLGHTYRYYLRRAAMAAGHDTTSVRTANEWAILSGKVAKRITNKAIVTGLMKDATRKRTWKEQFADSYMRSRHPIIYYIIHYDDFLEHFDVSIASHAALLLFRDKFVEMMDREIEKLERTKQEYERSGNAVAIRGKRDELKALAWSDESAWSRLEVKCPTGSSCAYSYALSDSYLETTFKGDRAAAERWSIQATAEAIGKMAAAAKDSRDKAKNVPEKEVQQLLEMLGRSYEPMLPYIVPLLMKQDAAGKWVPDLNAFYSLRDLHGVTDTLEAQEALAHEDTMFLLRFAMVPVAAVAAPALVGAGIADGAVAFGLWSADFILTDVTPSLMAMPSTRFALGASLVLGAEHLTELEGQQRQIFHRMIDAFAVSTATTAAFGVGSEGLVPLAKATTNSAAKLARPYVQEIKLRGLRAFTKLSREAQAQVLSLMLRAKSVEAEGLLAMAGGLERDAVIAVDRLVKEADITLPKPVERPVVAAKGDLSIAKAETTDLPSMNEVQGKTSLIPEEVIRRSKTATQGMTTANTPGGQDPGILEIEIVRGADGATSSALPLRAQNGGQLERFNIGDGRRLGEGVWNEVFDLQARNGRPVENPSVIKVLKTAEDAGDGHFTPRETVANSIPAYNDFVAEGIPVLKTEFFPDGATRNGPRPFMIQERIETNSIVLRELLKERRVPNASQRRMEIGTLMQEEQLPDTALRKFFDLVKRMNENRGRVLEDAHDGNFFVEIPEGATWNDFYAGNVDCRVGPLEFDRSIRWQDYLEGNAGKMGEWMTLIELASGPKKIKSLRRFYANEENRRLVRELAHLQTQVALKMNKLGTVLPPDDPALVALNQFLHDNPGPHWPADINFYQGKLLEGKRWVATVDTESGPVMTDGQIGKTKIPLKLVKDYFPRIDETTRFAPFAAADTTAPVANRLRRDRLPQGPVLRFPTARTRPRRPRTLRLAA